MSESFEIVVSPVLGENCVVVWDGLGGSIIIDPGANVTERVQEIHEQRNLRPKAIVITHGHVDHTWDAAKLSQAYDIPVWINAADAYRLTDPFTTLASAQLISLFHQVGLSEKNYVSPTNIETFDSTEDFERAGLFLTAIPAPGHTEGSTLYGFRHQVIFSGDVLFNNGVGRTDLPGGDARVMFDTLKNVVGQLSDDLLVIPGHGPGTTIGHEKMSNPYLLQAISRLDK